MNGILMEGKCEGNLVVYIQHLSKLFSISAAGSEDNGKQNLIEYDTFSQGYVYSPGYIFCTFVVIYRRMNMNSSTFGTSQAFEHTFTKLCATILSKTHAFIITWYPAHLTTARPCQA